MGVEVEGRDNLSPQRLFLISSESLKIGISYRVITFVRISSDE